MSDQCCSPTRDTTATVRTAVRRGGEHRGMVDLPAGTFRMGEDGPDANIGDGEGPVREVEVAPFRLSSTCVTNRQFAGFVKITGYVTEAERFGWSFVFHLLAPVGVRSSPDVRRVAAAPWWLAVEGASWRSPDGPGSSIAERPQHPVVHVSHNDALAYCDWTGTRLPSEAEWEFAARGGLDQQRFPWGDDLTPNGRWRCNIWQGDFPRANTEDDGHVGPAPVKTYAPNGYGLYEMTGNVWEWTADRWAMPDGSPVDPAADGHLTRKGGSYLCHDSYCNRYRCAARDHSAPDDATGNIGFRVAADAQS